MNLLLDTHTFLWFAWNDAQLSGKARKLIANRSDTVFLSTVSWWEIATKISIGKLTLGEPFDQFIRREMMQNNIVHLGIRLEHTDNYSSLPLHHRDPFDRMLIAQAMVEGYSIVGGDTAFDAYPVTRLW